MVLEHFSQIGARDSPFFVHNAPEDMAGSKINTDLARKLIDKLPNFAGVVDASLDWQFMIELVSVQHACVPTSGSYPEPS